MEMVHINSVNSGAIVNFPNSQIPYMKIYNTYTGIGSVVDIQSGEHLDIPLVIFYYGEMATVIANDISQWVNM